jgi:hypothetical protein
METTARRGASSPIIIRVINKLECNEMSRYAVRMEMHTVFGGGKPKVRTHGGTRRRSDKNIKMHLKQDRGT